MGKENSEVTSGVNAFALGVERVNPQARIYVHVTNSWYDPAGERLATRRLLDAGCDVIAQHCNTPDPQIEAEKAGVFGIGFHSDMRRSAPRAVLTSAIWKWGNYYTYLVRSVMDGTFTTRPWVGGLKDGMVDLAPLNPDLTDVAMEEVVAAARAAMEEGALTVFDGPMLTNDGRWIGREGDTLTDDEIFRNMNWYYHTVME